MQSSLDNAVESKNDIFVMNLKGSLDSVTAPDFWQYIHRKREVGYYRFLLNCESLESITSGGISVLLKLALTNKQMAFALIELNPEIISLFELLGLVKKLPLFQARKKAEMYLEDFLIDENTIENEGEGFSFHEDHSQSKLEIEETISSFQAKKEYTQKSQDRIVHYSSPMHDSADSGFNDNIIGNKLTPVFIAKVIQCEACGSRLRIARTGKHKCPACGIEFEVKSGESITYLEKLI